MSSPAKPPPYQPSLLRLLHGAIALLVPLAWNTGLQVFFAHDGRFGRLPFTLPGEWIDIHATVGVWALLWAGASSCRRTGYGMAGWITSFPPSICWPGC